MSFGGYWIDHLCRSKHKSICEIRASKEGWVKSDCIKPKKGAPKIKTKPKPFSPVPVKNKAGEVDNPRKAFDKDQNSITFGTTEDLASDSLNSTN